MIVPSNCVRFKHKKEPLRMKIFHHNQQIKSLNESLSLPVDGPSPSSFIACYTNIKDCSCSKTFCGELEACVMDDVRHLELG